MGDLMTFPNTVEEFMEQYKITDIEMATHKQRSRWCGARIANIQSIGTRTKEDASCGTKQG